MLSEELVLVVNGHIDDIEQIQENESIDRNGKEKDRKIEIEKTNNGISEDI